MLSAIGDKHNALIRVTAKTSLARGAPKVTLPAARLCLVDDKRVVSEKVIFYAAAEK